MIIALLLAASANAVEIRSLDGIAPVPSVSLGASAAVRTFQPRAPMTDAVTAIAALPAPAFAAGFFPTRQAPAAETASRALPVLPGLNRFVQAVQASERRGGNGAQAQNAGYFDGEQVHEEERVELQARENKEQASIHLERPAFDYLRNHFDPEEAREFAAASYALADGTVRTGHQLLAMLMTSQALSPDLLPDFTLAGPANFGKSDSELRRTLEEEGLPVTAYYALQGFLDKAFLRGIVFRVNDAGTKKTYYGVPERPRAELGLAPSSTPSAPKAGSAASAFAEPLAEVARRAESLPAGDELFEYAAQIALDAVDAGLLHRSDVPPSFLKRADAIGLIGGPLNSSLLTFLETAAVYGQPWTQPAKALGKAAIGAGLLSAEEVDAALAAR